MFSRYVRRWAPRPPRRSYYNPFRYSTRFSSFSPWGENRIRYGSRRRNRRRRRHFWNRDRTFFPRTTVDEIPEEEEPEVPEPPSGLVLEVLHVEDLDFHIEDNCKEHRTSAYDKTKERMSDTGEKEDPELVIRRGQNFKLTIELDRDYDKVNDDLRLVFKIGGDPRIKDGTLVQIKVNEDNSEDKKDVSKWYAEIEELAKKKVTFSIYPAANCIIGEWDFIVETVLVKDNQPPIVAEYNDPDNIYILLNPFCPEDAVYMPTKALLDEYLLNDQGGLFYGSSNKPRARPWFFGQFEDGILDVSLHLLRKGYGIEVTRDMADPISICRMLSKMVNSNDDNGVLTGNWSGDYSGGTRPTAWNGSVSILKDYIEHKVPVNYGQCWVFSGILTTVCRAVGLPCRSVTNFDSAHDTNASATIDKYFRMKDGVRQDVGFLNKDSIWNYHVWNEAWFKRTDLPHGYDGWQAIDATPQEKSDGEFQCGPSPVIAVKRGHLWLGQDSTFVFSEVNGNEITYEVLDNYDTRVVKVDMKKVGKKISTKKPNGKPLGKYYGFGEHPDRLDVTNEYKYTDGSREEKRVQEGVARFIGNVGSFDLGEEEILPLVDDIKSVLVGSDVEFKCSVHNVSRSTRTVDVIISARMEKYTGEVLEEVKSITFKDEVLKSGETKKLSLAIKDDDYLEKLKGEDSMKIEVVGKVKETGASFVRDDIFTFDHPELEVTAAGPFAVDKPFEVKVTVKNPLKIPLTDLSLRLDGPGIRATGRVIIPKQKVVPPMGNFTEFVSLTPKRAGDKAIAASLDSKELPDMTGVLEIVVPS